MKVVSQICFLIALGCLVSSCLGQANIEGKGESIVSHYGITKKASSTDTSAGWKIDGQKLLLTGTILELDGKTPSPGVLLYYYQTNPEGKYIHKPEEVRSMTPNERGQTHGFIRGWILTDAKGKYSIYTIKPGSYPTNDEPAHIHVTLKEPRNIQEYYVDDFVFDDDKLLTSPKRQSLENRSGSGIVRMAPKGDLLIGERDLVLGLNIPGYPKKQ